LVLHCFGSKRGLFAAAIGVAGDVDTLIDSLLTGPVSGLGERLVRFYLSWSTPRPAPSWPSALGGV